GCAALGAGGLMPQDDDPRRDPLASEHLAEHLAEPAHDPWEPEDRLALSDEEVARRLEFLGFTEEDAARLRAHLPALRPHLPEVACALYGHAATVPHLARLIEG